MIGGDRARFDDILARLARENERLIDHYHTEPIAEVDSIQLLEDTDLAREALRATIRLSIRLASQMRGL